MNKSIEVMTNKSCEVHDQSWYLSCQTGDHLCAKCCQMVWKSCLESDSTRTELLSQLESCLRHGPKLSTTLSDSQRITSGETHLFVESIITLIYYSDHRIRNLSKNCLNLLITQINEQSIIEFIFEEIVQKISINSDNWNESVMDLIADLIPELSLSSHPLRDDIDILFQRFQIEFIRLNDGLKTSLLRIFHKFYLNLKTNELFALDMDFHQKTLAIVFSTFEELNKQSNDSQLILNSIELLKELSQIESIQKSLATDQNLVRHLEKLLNFKFIEIKCSLLNWICDLLEKESIQRAFAFTLERGLMDRFIDELLSSKNASISSNLLECVYLVLENIHKMANETKMESLFKSVIKSLKLSVSGKDNRLFQMGLSVLMLILKKKSNTQVLSEFDFFLILDLLDVSISTPNLFTKVVDVCTELFDIKLIPILIPTQRMKRILIKVLQNIPNIDSECDDPQQSIERTIKAVNLIKSCLNLINGKKGKEFEHKLNPEIRDFHLVNNEKQWNSDDFDFEEGYKKCKSIKVSEKSEVYEFLSFCLKNIEIFFTNSLEELLSNRHLVKNSELFEEICSCLTIIIENDLFVVEDINRFITKMFSNGYVLSVVQLLWFWENSSDSEMFVSNLSTLLSHFIFKIGEFERINQNKIDQKLIRKALIECKEKYSIVSTDISNDLSEDEDNVVDTFFAINYYCQKFLSKENYEMNLTYSRQFLKVLNKYLRNNLSVASNSISTIKYSLFLSSLCDLEDNSMKALQQFFEKRDDSFYSKYYTNHMKLLEWLFTDLKCDSFCEFALKMFLREVPDSYSNFEAKHKMSAFFSLIDTNERAVKVLISTLCDTRGDNCAVDIIVKILEDCDQFIDESDIYNNRQLFCESLCENIPLIVDKMVAQIKDIKITWNTDCQDEDQKAINMVNPESVAKVIKLLTFLHRLLSNEMNDYQFEFFADKFSSLLQKLCHLIDHHLDDSSAQTIFKFFRLCLNSNRDSKTIDESLTDNLFKSKICVNSMFTYVDNDLPTDENKETALFLLSVLSKNKSIYDLEHRFVYELDINRLMLSLNSESKVETESAFILLSNSFKSKTYFDLKEKNDEIKCEEMRKLLHCLQNAVFRRYVTFSQISVFLKAFFNDIKERNLDLMKDLANSRWFEVIINHYLDAEEPLERQEEEEEEILQKDNDMIEEVEDQRNKIMCPTLVQPIQEKDIKQKTRRLRMFREEFIDFLLVFIELDFVNTALVRVINEMTEAFVQFIDTMEGRIDVCIKDKVLKSLKTIDCGKYAKYLTKQNKKLLKSISEKPTIIDITPEHNYCSLDF